ncbi:baseplate J/gp47 family protein [Lapidilactobacillus bayanensis]|uniref:baseplate J/gp47 family protein n=1 Tax=Lapidilactobacillus bayanensis TaxID=2485998 RepID=UPI000F78D610|nr:baseplate J/gp47 family protein [Lapidilactobacillus bayanensis]
MTPEEYVTQLEKYDFNYFIDEALSHVPNTIDTRQGSIIYDALAPVAYSYAEIAMNLRNIIVATFTQTASGEFLDYRGAERGLKRYEATNAEATAEFKDANNQNVVVEIGDRFASIGATPFFYAVTKINGDGTAQLTCESSGSEANHYVGQILPITPNDELATATITSISVPARDAESDEDFRQRILKAPSDVAYGGNIADYQKMVSELGDVGAVQVYPIWNGGGTVKLVILNNSFDIPSQQLISEVKEAIDPTDVSGEGYGLAPIGHVVTVVVPTAANVNIKVDLELDPAADHSTVINSTKQALADYLLTLRKSWDKLPTGSRYYKLVVYRSQILATILKTPGIINATNLLLNNSDQDIQLTMTNTTSQLPLLGEVTINEPIN